MELSSEDPGLVGLTRGAAVVRRAQRTRHALHILKRVQLMQGSGDSEADASKPQQVRREHTHRRKGEGTTTQNQRSRRGVGARGKGRAGACSHTAHVKQ